VNLHRIVLAGVVLASLGAASAAAAVATDAAEPAPTTAPVGNAPSGRVRAWSGTLSDGSNAVVPAPDATTVLAFVRPDQSQSKTALSQLEVAAGGRRDARVIVIVSGKAAADAAANSAMSRAFVSDPDFSVAGRFDVHVWPTTLIVGTDGAIAGRLPGMTGTYAADLADMLAFAGGEIDRATLKNRLEEHAVVGDGQHARKDHTAALAGGLLESGHVDQAAAQVEQALKARPDDPQLLFLHARVLVQQSKAQDALTALDRIPSGALPAWQASQLRGRALIDLGRWEDAKAAVEQAFALNPRPAEAHYLLGQIHRHAGDWQSAAEQFRLAYEASRK
jgi:hypothetical protein